MKTAIAFISDNQNDYIASISEQIISPAHPLLIYFLENGHLYEKNISLIPSCISLGGIEYDKDDIFYYFYKYIYYKSNNILSSKDSDQKNTESIKAESIEAQLANLTHLVFEVTDSCNLQCKYCAYGELYDNYDSRSSKYMQFEQAKLLLDHLHKLWESPMNLSKQDITIGFYGGEPLLNMKLIKKITEYIDSKMFTNNKIRYTMTTNALLLHRYIDFLVDKNFSLLISLDGNEYNNSYRIKKNNENSFSDIYENINLIKNNYPNYFDERVNFNAVLHNRNSVDEIVGYIYNEFGKVPSIGEVNDNGVEFNKNEDFKGVYKNFRENIYQSENYENISDVLGFNNPYAMGAAIFIHQYSGNVLKRYSDFFIKEESYKQLPTGTCFPFSRKIFVTVNGKILPCEKIGHNYSLGQISNDCLDLDSTKIAKSYNAYFSKLRKQCDNCYVSKTCTQCVFYITDLTQNPRCEKFTNEHSLKKYLSHQISVLENNPKIYHDCMTDLILKV